METKQILCFGDSNTWGFCPQSTSVACCRYPFSQRWTGVLQGMLDDGYRIAEEGLNGRTTVFEDPLFPDRRGMDAIDMLVRTHSPLDLVLIMLGTNDMKDHLGTTNHAVARGVRALCEHALSVGAESGKKPRVLAVSPIAIGENVEETWLGGEFSSRSVERSLTISGEIQEQVGQIGVSFFDAKTVARPSPADCVHLDAQGHAQLAAALAAQVRALIG